MADSSGSMVFTGYSPSVMDGPKINRYGSPAGLADDCLRISVDAAADVLIRLADFCNAGQLGGPAAYRFNAVADFLRKTGIHCEHELTCNRQMWLITGIFLGGKRYPVTAGLAYMDELLTKPPNFWEEVTDHIPESGG